MHKIVAVQGLQHVDLAARQQGTVDFKRGVFGGGPDQRYLPFLYGPQQRVLLPFVEAVNLVDEDYGREQSGGSGQHVANFFHARIDGTESHERAFYGLGQQQGQRGFAHAGRTPQDHRRQPTRRHRHAQRPTGTNQFSLTNDFVQRAGPNPFGQGNRGCMHATKLPKTNGASGPNH